MDVLIGCIHSVATEKGMPLTDVEPVCTTMKTALCNFAKCHKGYSKGSMTTEEIDALGR